MLSFIAANYKKGDSIEICCSEGKTSGEIVFVDHNGIVLLLPNGNVCGIATADVRSFTAPKPGSIVLPHDASSNTYTPAATAPQEQPSEETLPTPEPEAEEEEKATSIADVLTPEDAPEDGNALTGALSTPAVKVVGKISLEHLQKVDPKFNKGYIFNKKENNASNANTVNEVPPMGRITHFNPMKNYGFIHDDELNSDLYFNLLSIVDDSLKRNVKVGTPVVYSVKRNAVGYVAFGIHAPAPIDELLDLVDAHIEKGHFTTAEMLLDHILKVDANNRDALDLKAEVKSFIPTKPSKPYNAPKAPKAPKAPQPVNKKENLFNEDVLYAKAKRASLEKNFDEAEKLYIKALHAGQRVESCVKDMLQIYVMRYKRVDTPEEAEKAFQSAIAAYDKYKSYLSDDLSTLQFLAGNFYLPLNDYETYLELSKKILTRPEVNTTSKRVFYIWQQALALHKLNRDEEALAMLEEGLQQSPNHTQMKNLKEVIEHPELFPFSNPADNKKGEAEAKETAPEAPAESQPQTTASEAEAEATTAEAEAAE